jgi:hypothetical protein
MQMIRFANLGNPGYLNVRIQFACGTKRYIKKLHKLIVSISRCTLGNIAGD